jgi:hypothetical protein
MLTDTPKIIARKSNTEWLSWLIVILMLLAGLAIRLYDLTDPPMDFHPTRQLRGAIIARSIYLNMLPGADPEQRQLATSFAGLTGRYEPPILETLVANTYRIIGQELFWISRIYNSVFWLVGGVFLFLLGRCMTNIGGGLIALGYYLFLPFAAQASRSFQLIRDGDVAGNFRLFSLPLGRGEILEMGSGNRHSRRIGYIHQTGGGIYCWCSFNRSGLVQPWVEAFSPPSSGMDHGFFDGDPVLWILSAIGGQQRADYLANWTVALSHLIVEPAFYVRWLSFVQNWMGFSVILLALIGVIIASPRSKVILSGLWVGYFIYGLTLPYQMYTHNYYHLQLVPILALSLTPLGQILLERLSNQSKTWKVILAGVALLAVIFPCWVAISTLKAEDFRKEPTYWQKIGDLLPVDGRIIALTQDYGYRLMYYGWRKVTLWQTSSEQNLAELRNREKEFSTSFSNRIEGKDYFLVTAMGQWKSQPTLQKTLTENYPLIAEGDGYLLFDLVHPLSP